MNTENSKNNVPEHNTEYQNAVAPPVARPVASAPAAVPLTENSPPPEKNLEPPPAATPENLRARAGSLLAQLNPAQRTQLFQWLQEYTIPAVLDFIAAPPPAGFGIQTHKTTLRRLKGLLRSHSASVAFENAAATAEVLTETIQENRPQFAPLISELLLRRAFDQAADTSRAHDLKDLVNSAIKLRELELKVQRLQLLRERQQRETRRARIRVQVTPLSSNNQ